MPAKNEVYYPRSPVDGFSERRLAKPPGTHPALPSCADSLNVQFESTPSRARFFLRRVVLSQKLGALACLNILSEDS